ncbi:MAG: Cof-type HAD-IIB family hydrolase [Lachnospiraceae bacterium]|nr:Cof-type HAD-IIB family hydrolase [Lachnospiraceae bacterium]
MYSKKLIFVDIDGTIYMMDHGVSPALAEGFRRARANGHKVFISTGRTWNSLPEEVTALEWDGIVASAGSDIRIDGKSVYRYALEPARVRRIIAVMEQIPGVIFMLEGFDRIFVAGDGSTYLWEDMPMPDVNPELARWLQFLKKRKNTWPLSERNPELDEIPKVSFLVRSQEALGQIRRELGDQFHVATYHIYQSAGMYNGELISHESDKGTGIVKTAELFGADVADTIAFGDSLNDYQMIERAGVGVAMGNADEELKAIADRVCESVWDDGVLHEMERMGLL